MITHVILIQPKVSTSNEKLLALLEHIQALKDIIPGILSISVGENLSLYHRGFTENRI